MRLAGETLRQLEEEAAHYRQPVRTLAERMIEEGVRMARFPGITFVDRPAGRDAVLIGHPRLSIWIIAMTARSCASLAEAAKVLSLGLPLVERAMAYAGAYPAEIEQAITQNDAAFERGKRLFPSALPRRPKGRRRAAAAR